MCQVLPPSIRSDIENMEQFKRYYDDAVGDCVILVIHSLDRLSQDCGRTLRALSESRRIRIVASIDHMNAATIYQDTSFNWIRHDTPTFVPYGAETSLKLPIAGAAQGRSEAGVKNIVQVLTEHQQTVLNIIGKHQLEHRKGIKFVDLMEECRTQLYMDNNLFVRSILAELKSHKLVQTTLRENIEYVTVPLSTRLITAIVTDK